MLILDIIAIIIIMVAFYAGSFRYNPAGTKWIYWALFALGVILIIASRLISGAAM